MRMTSSFLRTRHAFTIAALMLALSTPGIAQAYTNPIITNTRDPDCSRFDGMFHLIEPGGGDVNGGFYKYRTSIDLATSLNRVVATSTGASINTGHRSTS